MGWVLALAALAGCAGGGSGGGGPLPTYADFDPATAKPRACDALTLSASSAEPLDQVTISGLPADLGQIAVYLETVAGAIGHLYPTGPVAGGEATFTVPPSPDGDPDGGDAMLTVTNADEACPAIPFTIDALPAAPADYATYMADLADTMREFLDLLAQVFGTDYATLSAAAAPPADGLLPIYLAVRVFDAGLQPPPDLDTDADRELVVRLLAKADAPGVLEAAIGDLEQYLADVGSFKVAPGPARKAVGGAPDGSTTVRGAAGECTSIEPPDLDIPSTARLSAVMTNPAIEALGAGLDAFTSTMAAISSVLGVAGLSGPTDVMGVLATTTGTAVDFAMAAAPSAFTSLNFDAETPLWEDMAPTEAAWSNAQAHVISTPFSVTRAVAENLLALAGMAGLPGWAVTVVTYSYEDEVNGALDDIADSEGPLCVTVPAQEWGPFDVTSSDWSVSEVVGTTVTKKTHTTYVPAMLGQSELRVRIKPEKFGGATIVANNFVTVNAKTVSISPISPKVDKPGDPVHLEVSVNAFFPEAVTWTPPAGAGAVTHVYQGGGIHTFDFASPGSENLFPAPFSVRSTSGEVPPNTFERADSVDILLNVGLEITGARACIAPGGTVDLEAVLTGFTDPDARVVTWTQTAGTTTPGSPTRLATYQAPSTEGTVTVHAETPAPGVGAPPLKDDVDMLVSTTCIRQFFTAHLISTTNGDPDCDGPLSLRPDDADSIDDWEDIAGLHVPTPQGPYFGTGDVDLDTLSSFVESRRVTRGGVDSCETLLPFATGHVHIASDASATADWDASFIDRGTCTTDDSGDVCNVGQTGYVVGHYIYLPITEAGTYRFNLDLACSLYPHYGDIQLFVARYIDGTDFTLPNGPDSVPTPADPTPAVPFVPPILSLEDLDCTGTTASRSVVMDLTGPLGTTGSDLVTVYYVTGPTGFVGGLTPAEILENADALDPTKQGPSPEFIHDMTVHTMLERLD